MIDIRTGKELTRGNFLKGGLAAILASGVAPSLVGSANASVGRGIMRNVGARNATMFGGKSLPYKKRFTCIKSSTKKEYLYFDYSDIVTGFVDIYLTARLDDSDIGGGSKVAYSPTSGSQGWYGWSGDFVYGYSGKTSIDAHQINVFHEQKTSVSGNNRRYLFINGDYSGEFSSYYDSKLVWLFTLQGAYGSITYIYVFEIYRNDGTCYMRLIPVLDKDDVVCMYDEISGNFHYNQGTGAFVGVE